MMGRIYYGPVAMQFSEVVASYKNWVFLDKISE